MTDEQIIKALKCCVKTEFISDCAKCKMFAFDCKDILIENALDLINRQKAEIEELKTEIERMEDENYTLKNKIEIRDNLIEQLGSDINIKYNTIYTMREKLKNSKSEAIKEFAERLKKHSFVDNLSLDGKETVYVDDIDKLVKEMTEG